MKTGTSAIQSFLGDNAKALLNMGILYPTVNQEAMNYLAFCLMEKVPPYVHKLPISRENLYAKLKNEIENTRCDRVIISSEAYSLVTTDYFLGAETPKKVKELLFSPNFEFKVIASVRRQDEYLVSQYNQHVKTHNFWGLYTGDPSEFYEDKKKLFDFNLTLEQWEKFFGKDNIIVGVYDKSANAVNDFMKLFGIENISQYNSKVDVNTRMTCKIIRIYARSK